MKERLAGVYAEEWPRCVAILTRVLGAFLHDTGEFDLQPARQLETELAGQHIRHPALT